MVDREGEALLLSREEILRKKAIPVIPAAARKGASLAAKEAKAATRAASQLLVRRKGELW